MKRLFFLFFSIAFISTTKGQDFSFVTYTENAIEYDFIVETGKKNIKEKAGGLFNIDLPYFDTYQTNEFICFSLKKGYALPKGITDLDKCSNFFAISTVTGIFTLKFDRDDKKYEFIPKEFVLNDQKELPDLLNRIKNLKKALSSNLSSTNSSITNSNTSSSTNSLSTSSRYIVKNTYNSKGGFYYSGTYLIPSIKPKSVHSHLKECIGKWGQCKVVGLNSKGSGVAIYGSNGYAYESITDKFADELKKRNNQKVNFIDVNITESEAYVFIFDQNGYLFRGAPTAFSERIKVINKNGGTILSASFNDKGKWAIITTKANYGDNETMAFINKAKQKYGGVLSVFLSENGCIACCSRGFFFENIPQKVVEQIKGISFKPNFVKFTDDGLSVITNKNGAYWYYL